MAFTAVAALATAGGATALGVSVVTAMSYVGIAMAVVGAVTKDKQLMQTGGLLSLMGGVGAAVEGASAAMGSAATEAAAGTAAETQAAEAAMGATASPAAAPVVAQAQPAGLIEAGGDAGLISAAPAPVATPATPAPVSAPTTAPIQAAAAPAQAGLPAGSSESLAGVQGATAPTTPYATYPGEFVKQPADDFFGKVGGVWESLGGQGKAAAIQMIGGAMSGANQSAMWNEEMDLKNRALAQRSYGSQVAKYNKPGLINAKA